MDTTLATVKKCVEAFTHDDSKTHPSFRCLKIGTHDIAGEERFNGPIPDINSHDMLQWELEVHAAFRLLRSKGLMDVTQLRVGIEGMEPSAYLESSYFEKWACSITKHVLSSGLVKQANFDACFGVVPIESPPVLFGVGNSVTVRAEEVGLRWRKPHMRTPGYLFGATGVVTSVAGIFDDPMINAVLGSPSVKMPLYRVTFKQKQIWPSYEGGADDIVTVEIFQAWLVKTTDSGEATIAPDPLPTVGEQPAIKWDGDWLRVHKSRAQIEAKAAAAEPQPKRFQPLGEALVATLCDAGVFSRAELATMVEFTLTRFNYDSPDARRMVARAWLDPEYKALLLTNPIAAQKQLNVSPIEPTLVVLENTPFTHNVVVCTLCSCWPVALMGYPPAWYKSNEYRARTIREPRKVLKEFGLELPLDVTVATSDSTADLRYMVLPNPPLNSNDLSEAELAELVTPNALIGVSVCKRHA